MHYGSGTVDRIASRQPADAPGNRQMLHVHSSDGSTFLGETMSWPQSWKYDIILEMQLYQLMHIYLKNNSAEFNLDSVWNDGALGFLERSPPKVAPRRRTRWIVIWIMESVPNLKIQI